MTGITVNGLQQRRGREFRVEVPELHLPAGGSALVLGPSGSGKSSFLRLLAGLERPDRGTIHIHGVEVAGPSAWVPPHRRAAALLSQDFGLWPHLSAAKHLAFVRTRGHSLAPAHEDYEILEQVGLGTKGEARPCALSGGEQQRLALARALAARPRLLLLDEPFANVDVVLARQLHDLVNLLRCTWGFTLVQVAHHAQRAVATADVVAIFHNGALRQSGTWASIAQAPGDEWVRDVVEVFA